MSPERQLNLDDASRREPSSSPRLRRFHPARLWRGLGRGFANVPSALDLLGSRLLYWSPVWLPLILVSQLALGGLRPALAEVRRLDAAEIEVRAFERMLDDEALVLRTSERKLGDPIYRERVRKSLTSGGSAPLLLGDRSSRAARMRAARHTRDS